MPPVLRSPTLPDTPAPAPTAEYDYSHWKRAQVRYAPKDGRKAREVEGLVYGPWAVVQDDRNGKYDLVHVRADMPTVIDIETEADACRIGDWLWKTFPLVMRLKTVDEMREKIPPATRSALNRWGQSCTKAGRWVAPPKV